MKDNKNTTAPKASSSQSPKNPNPGGMKNGNAGEPKPLARVYKGSQEVDHDAFKLKVSTMKKNISFNDKPDIVKIEHCHIFHTIDSNGKSQDTYNQVGGHLHEITVTHSTNGVPSVEVGPPMKYIRQKIKGVFKRVLAPVELGDGEIDDHTHEVEYLGSDRIQLRKANTEFAKFQAEVRATQEPSIEGVVAG